MADETLLTLANEVRGKTLRLLDGVAPDAARFTGPGLNNSILWHGGHALMLVEHLCIAPATGGTPLYPKGWFEVFGWQSRPATVPPDAWPPLAEVVERLREQLDRLRSVINSLAPDELGRIFDPARNRTLRYSIVHGLHDEASHQGEIHLLRKLYGNKRRPQRARALDVISLMAVSRRRRWVVAVVVGLLSLAFGVVAYALYQLNQSTKAMNTQSHVAALNHALRQYFNDHTDWADANTRAGAGEWVVVDRQTTRRLLADVSGRYGADPVFADDLTVDAWHRPLRLELSRDRSGRVLHRITSFGPDGIQGTSDDLTFSSDVFAAASTRPS